jgi:hypothetical protein
MEAVATVSTEPADHNPPPVAEAADYNPPPVGEAAEPRDPLSPFGQFRRAALRCFNQRLKSNPDHAGRLSLEVTFRGGRAIQVNVRADEPVAEFAGCLRQAAMRLRIESLAETVTTIPMFLDTGTQAP